MSDLTTGGGTLPPGWGYPSPIYVAGQYYSGGMVWMGKQAAQESDIEALKKSQGGDVSIDAKTLKGLYHWSWITTFDMYSKNPDKMGGLGSQNYENQHVGESQGALFAKEDIWYTNTSGKLVKGIPPENAGCYHYEYVGEGYYDAYEGVEPGSPAEEILGKGEFYWDEKRRLYSQRSRR